jgi:EAL domain-containing protein (putative c-di-GMP-specific phosphodiesterase class I)
VYVSASAGIVISDKTYERADQILRDGDIALHRAKARGPGERQVFDAEMHRQAVLRLQLDTDLRRALERRELSVHYQPIVDARARRVVGFEALVRWRHPEKGLLTPDVFIPVAEATGLIDRLGLIVLEQACRDLRRLESRRAGDPTPLRMSVNLSAAQLRSVRLCEHIRQVLEETGAPPSALIVELTESAILNDKTRARAALDQLRGLGVHIHIDDFGTGYSSLGHLHALPVDALKIDRTFVARLDTKDGSVEIVRAIMALAQALHLEAVAEGVETREQLAILRAMGCSIVQGFLFARTMPVEEAEAWLSNDPLGAF